MAGFLISSAVLEEGVAEEVDPQGYEIPEAEHLVAVAAKEVSERR